jgi:crossover junction endodeoxyribonuclease RuvC
MTIIGIDPGLATTGFGIIKHNNTKNGSFIECVSYGAILTEPDMELPYRLKKISNHLTQIIKEYSPEALIMENVFFFKNAKTIVPVSQAQGVILLVAAKKKIPVYRYTPLEVKMTITGFGRAEKKDIQNEIKRILNLDAIPKPDDAADALSVAATYLIRQEKIS